MANPNVFPSQVFPVEYWPLEYWPISSTVVVVVDTHGCVDLNDILNNDVTIADSAYYVVTLTDTGNYEVVMTDVVCPN
jgi:hypothetical protein